MYGSCSYVANSIHDDFAVKVVEYLPPYYKETSVLTHLNIWRAKWPNSINIDFNFLPALLRYSFCILHPVLKRQSQKAQISLSYRSPINSLLEITSLKNMSYEVIYLNEKCSRIKFINHAELVGAIQHVQNR